MRYAVPFLLTLLGAASISMGEDATVHVDARRTIAHVSHWTTGACIEDVNHEVYGGIYSQMVFGESFQEPPTATPPRGFTAFGGQWKVENGELVAAGDEGPKLILNEPSLSSGQVSVDVLLPDKHAGNAALIVKVE